MLFAAPPGRGGGAVTLCWVWRLLTCVSRQDAVEEPFVDVAVGGSELAGWEPDNLMVWAVTIRGRVSVSADSRHITGRVSVSADSRHITGRVSVSADSRHITGWLWADSYPSSSYYMLCTVETLFVTYMVLYT